MSGTASPRRAVRGLGKFEGFGPKPTVTEEPPPPAASLSTGADRAAGEGGRTAPPPAPVERPPRASAAPPETTTASRPAAPARSAAPHEPRRQRGRRQPLEERWDCEMLRTSIVLPLPVDDAITQIAFEQRRKGVTKNDVFLEAIELVLKRYGAGSMRMLVDKSRAG